MPLENQPRATTRKSHPVLRCDHNCNAGGALAELHSHRSSKSAVLGGDPERRRRCAPDGRHRSYGREQEGDGEARDPVLPQDNGLDSDCCHVLRVHWRGLDVEVKHMEHMVVCKHQLHVRRMIQQKPVHACASFSSVSTRSMEIPVTRPTIVASAG